MNMSGIGPRVIKQLFEEGLVMDVADLYQLTLDQLLALDKVQQKSAENILEAIERGVDMFDCIMPTRNGRNGQLFTARGTMNMRNRKWADDFSPIDPDGHCAVDLLHSRAYLHHLFRAEELLALQIASIHNLAFYLWLVGEARRHILAGDFTTWKAGMVKQLSERI